MNGLKICLANKSAWDGLLPSGSSSSQPAGQGSVGESGRILLVSISWSLEDYYAVKHHTNPVHLNLGGKWVKPKHSSPAQ